VSEATTSKATIAGVLDIIAGVMSLIGAGVTFLIGVVGSGAIRIAAGHDPHAGPLSLSPLAVFLPIAALCVLLGVVAIVGGIAAFHHQRMGLAVAGSIAALFAFLPLGIAAIILTVMAENEFRARQTPNSQF
jgi:hypothetical protein